MEIDINENGISTMAAGRRGATYRCGHFQESDSVPRAYRSDDPVLQALSTTIQTNKTKLVGKVKLRKREKTGILQRRGKSNSTRAMTRTPKCPGQPPRPSRVSS